MDISTEVVGHSFNVPWYIAPVGSLRALYPMGDAIASQVAGEFGTAMTLSTLSGTPMESVAEASEEIAGFNFIYVVGERQHWRY